MASRKTMLAVSFSCATLLYGGMFAAAPYIPLLKVNLPDQGVLATFRVDISHDRRHMAPRETERPGDLLASRPGSVRDLLARDEKALQTLDTQRDKVLSIPGLEERVGSDAIGREHDFSRNETLLKRVDAKIIEISEETAREGIKVARRLVRPSSNRVLKAGEYPVLRIRGGAYEGSAPIATLPSLPSTLVPSTLEPESAGERVRTVVREDARERPAFEEGTIAPAPEEGTLPDLAIEQFRVNEPIQQAIRTEAPYEFLDSLVDIKVDSYVAGPGEAGFFRLRIVPKDGEAMQVLPKDVTFVIDASNSILQRKLDLTVAGVGKCLNQIRRGDRFNIVIFRDTPSFFRADPVEVDPGTIKEALDFLRGLKSRGETDVYNAIRPVIQEPPRPGVPGIILVLTDGRPTTGVMNGREIINALTRENIHRNAIYAFGGGRTVNRYLLDLLAYRNKGQSRVVRRLDQIEEELPKFFGRINDPVLSGLKADYGRIGQEGIYPREVPDFYRGRVVTLYGRYNPARDKEIVMRLEGNAGTQKKELVFKADLREAGKGDASIARMWAFEKSYYLIGEMSRIGETPELLAELKRLSVKYDIATTYSN